MEPIGRILPFASTMGNALTDSCHSARVSFSTRDGVTELLPVLYFLGWRLTSRLDSTNYQHRAISATGFPFLLIGQDSPQIPEFIHNSLEYYGISLLNVMLICGARAVFLGVQNFLPFGKGKKES